MQLISPKQKALVFVALAGFMAQTVVAANYVEGEVLVTFKKSVSLDHARNAVRTNHLELTKHFPGISRFSGSQLGLVRARNMTTAQLIRVLERDPAVQMVEPSFLRRAYGTVPNDPLFSQLWGLRNSGQAVNGSAGKSGADIRFTQAWNLARSSTNEVVVAVIDSGVDYSHPDLAPNLWTNPGESASNGVDDDQNGYADDYYGYDFGEGDSDPSTVVEHGSHVAGTIAAAGNNRAGIIGVNYKARIMALKVGVDSNPGTFADAAIIEAIDYCVLMKGQGVNIVAINASWGGSDYNSALRAAIQASGDAGIVFCSAAGNAAANNDVTADYPGNYRLPNMLVVAATEMNDNLAGFSNYGATMVDLGAPGVNILSTVPRSDAPTFGLVLEGGQTFSANPLTYSPATSGITGQVYDCGFGYPEDFPAEVNGNIALISRGTLYFSEKLSNAVNAGAQGAIIYNNVSGNFSGTLGGAGNWIPAVSISDSDGAALKTVLPGAVTILSTNSPYEYLQGTSMATPHVVGAVAFAAMNFPNETPAQRVQRIRAAVDVVPGLQGRVATGGRLNLQKVVDLNGNGLPDWWEEQYFNNAIGVDPAADPDGDGASNLSEWLAGTDPLQSTSAFRVLSIQHTNRDILITWTTVPGRDYILQTATNSGAGPNDFTDIATNSPNAAVAGTNSFLHRGAGTNQAIYYRARQSQTGN